MTGITKLLIYTTVWLCLFFIVLFSAKAQQTLAPCTQTLDSVLHKTIYTTVDKMPEPIGGITVLNRTIYKQLKYPSGEGDYGGKTIVAFVVEANGKITGERAIRDPSGKRLLFSNQLIKIVKNLKWEPALCDNKPVAYLYILSVEIGIE